MSVPTAAKTRPVNRWILPDTRAELRIDVNESAR
jgi:hypothetical protein